MVLKIILLKTDAMAILCRREMSHANLRFLPKEDGMRPIVNLRRRFWRPMENGSGILAQSTNNILQNAFQVLNFERVS